MNTAFEKRLTALQRTHGSLLGMRNEKVGLGNGVFDRYRPAVLTAGQVPFAWRYDLNPATNPYLMDRFGVNAVFIAGALKFQGRYLLAARVEGADRKPFFALAESNNGLDNFRFRDEPLPLPLAGPGETNVYRYAFYTRPEDGFIGTGRGGGINFGLSRHIEGAVIDQGVAIDAKVYHTVYEAKNGLGPPPLKTDRGWLYVATTSLAQLPDYVTNTPPDGLSSVASRLTLHQIIEKNKAFAAKQNGQTLSRIHV